MKKQWHGPVAWRNWGNMTPSPPAPTPYTQGEGWYTDAELKPVPPAGGPRFA